MNKLIGSMVVCAASLMFGAAYGHGTPTPNHGGVVMAVDETWLELVVRGDVVELYLEDDGDPMDSAGVTGKLSVAGKPALLLMPAGGNKLKAANKVPLSNLGEARRAVWQETTQDTSSVIPAQAGIHASHELPR